MPDLTSGLVDIVREFLEADRLMRRLFSRYRSAELRFGELESMVSNDEGSVLYRLKERCHAHFRPGASNPSVAMHREALFDLAVGSLFHEAMKFRETFYQQEVYGPRVRALRSGAGAEAKGLFQEFERILAAGTQRLEEGLHECEALLDQTREQLRVMLIENRDNGFLARFMVKHPDEVEAVFGVDLDTLFREIHGDPAEGFALAGRSFLASGYYEAADGVLAEAARRGGERGRYEPLCAYARGMRAYLEGDYRGAVDHLGHWLDAGAPGDASLRPLAQAAASRIGQLAPEPEREGLASRAGDLQTRLAES